MKIEHIRNEEHRRVYAEERLSVDLADRGEDMPCPGEGRQEAVDEWLAEHPEIVVGREVWR